MNNIGSRASVWHGNAKHTSGGLTKNNLMMNKNGRIVSKSKHNTAKKEMRLVKCGYGTKRGKFGFVRIKPTRKCKGSKKGGGGMSQLYPANVGGSRRRGGGPLYPADIDGSGITVGTGQSGPLTQALTAGGRRRRRGHRGGTTKPFADLSMNAPLNMALTH